jgi:hypothetical protein
VAVTADNDYAFATATTGTSPQVRRNNIAQRNLTVIDVLATASVAFPFVAGNVLDHDTAMELVVNRALLPRHIPLLLALDDDGAAFPRLKFDRQQGAGAGGCGDGSMVFLDKTRIETKLGCCRGVLTLEGGSRFDCAAPRGPGKVTVQGGEVIIRDGMRFVEIRDEIVVVEMEKVPGFIYPFALRTEIPPGAQRGETYRISVSQRSPKGETKGGASVMYRVK